MSFSVEPVFSLVSIDCSASTVRRYDVKHGVKPIKIQEAEITWGSSPELLKKMIEDFRTGK